MKKAAVIWTKICRQHVSWEESKRYTETEHAHLAIRLWRKSRERAPHREKALREE
jgi:hypothetical protein